MSRAIGGYTPTETPGVRVDSPKSSKHLGDVFDRGSPTTRRAGGVSRLLVRTRFGFGEATGTISPATEQHPARAIKIPRIGTRGNRTSGVETSPAAAPRSARPTSTRKRSCPRACPDSYFGPADVVGATTPDAAGPTFASTVTSGPGAPGAGVAWILSSTGAKVS
jgi:hypothetical protein